MKNVKGLRFKKTQASDLTIEEGLTTNKHWVASTAWLLSLCATKNKLGIESLKEAVILKQVEIVKRRLEGAERSLWNLADKFSSILKENTLKEVSRESVIFHKGYIGRKNSNTYISFSGKQAPFVAIHYAAMLFFDTSTTIYISETSGFSLVFLKDSAGNFIAAIAPLNPDRILKGDT